MKRKQKVRLSVLLSLMSVFIFMFGLKQWFSPNLLPDTRVFKKHMH